MRFYKRKLFPATRTAHKVSMYLLYTGKGGVTDWKPKRILTFLNWDF